MEDEALLIFAAVSTAPTLGALQEGLRRAGHPASLATGIAGEATPDEMSATDWDAAFVRWNEPEPHEVWLIERSVVGEDAQADLLVKNTLGRIADHPDAAGRLIVSEHLRRTRAVYAVSILPALIADEDHAAWGALDVTLTDLARTSDGLIYAQSEGFYDESGEMLLSEDEEEPVGLDNDEE